MQSMKDSLKGFDLEALKQKALAMKANQESQRADGTTPLYRCQKCKDEGGTLVKRSVTQTVQGELKEVDMDHWQACDCVTKFKEQERMEGLSRSSQITLKFRRKTFDAFNLENVADVVREAYRKARVYRVKFNDIRNTDDNGFCLLGRPGCGKTHLIMAIVNELLDEGIEVLYFPYVEGFEEIKDDMKKDDVNKERFDKLKRVPVLFIDDLFKPPHQPSTYEIKQMFNVINYRYMEKLPTLISSEYPMKKLIELDEGLGSRINEMCREFRIELMGGQELNWRLREEAS